MKTVKIIRYDNDKKRIGDEVTVSLSTTNSNTKMPLWFKKWNEEIYEKNQSDTNESLSELKVNQKKMNNNLNEFKQKVHGVFKRNNLK
ncbi:MAG: hypothetical protein LBS95_00770 [Mycoplasmataceae bacterium]|nr:hypothetical protein [Mycoplasmataceae bacterium]